MDFFQDQKYLHFVFHQNTSQIVQIQNLHRIAQHIESGNTTGVSDVSINEANHGTHSYIGITLKAPKSAPNLPDFDL